MISMADLWIFNPGLPLCEILANRTGTVGASDGLADDGANRLNKEEKDFFGDEGLPDEGDDEGVASFDGAPSTP